MTRLFGSFLCILLFCAEGLAQHPWDEVLISTTKDASATLNLSTTAEVCVSGFKGEGIPDSVTTALEEQFALRLQEAASGTKVNMDCPESNFNAQITTVDGQSSFKVNAAGNVSDRSWEAVFYLPETSTLPKIDSVDVFNQAYFVIPDLPAQVKVTRMSGAEIEGKLISSDGIDLVIQTTKKNGKQKIKNIHKSEIFSVEFPEGEWVLYAPDDALGDEFSVDEMRIFIAGEQDAMNGYNGLPTAGVGFLLAGTAAVLANGGLILSILPPVIYTVAQLIPVIKIQGKTISNPNYKHNEIYAMGYERVARSRKLMAGLKGSVLGALGGIGIYFLTK